eukprot:3162-Pelagomonas_calceolata.AAC.1
MLTKRFAGIKNSFRPVRHEGCCWTIHMTSLETLSHIGCSIFKRNRPIPPPWDNEVDWGVYTDLPTQWVHRGLLGMAGFDPWALRQV